jgi:hypothetical protein
MLKKKFKRWMRNNIVFFMGGKNFVGVYYARFPRYFITAKYLSTQEYDNLCYHKNDDFEESIFNELKWAKYIREKNNDHHVMECLNCGKKWDSYDRVDFQDGRWQHRNFCTCGMKLRD